MLTILTIEEILDKYPNLKQSVENLVKAGKLKNDGAIDEIPNLPKKNVISTSKLRFILEVQRVDDIEEANILRNLEEYGGFSHGASGVIDVFSYEDILLEYVTSPDGMHRAIKAYLCGVPELAINEQEVHPIAATEEEIIAKEKKFFDDKNVRSAKVSTSSQMRSDKLSGKMTADQVKLDKALSDAYIHINEYGCSKEAALFELDSFAEIPKLITNQKSVFYIGSDELNKTVSYMSDFLCKDALSPKQFCADAYIFSVPFKDNEDQKVLYKKFLTSSGKHSYGSYDESFWTDKVQHSRGFESAVVRKLVAFNQWHRLCFDEDALDMSYFEQILKVMNVETRHFVEDCITQGICIKKYNPFSSKVDEVEEEEETLQTA
jgi:hypothetical protein